MLNLIRKDIVIQKKTLIGTLLLLIVYLLLGISSIWIGTIFSIILIMNAYKMDEKSSINILLNSLPYTRKEIVSSKYIGAFIFTCLVVFTTFIGELILHQELTIWKDMLFIVSLVMVAMSLIFPLSYKYKSQYMMISSLVLFAIYMFLLNFFIPNLNDIIREFVQMALNLQTTQFYLYIALSIITLYTCSWLLSIRIYERKVF